MDSSKKNNIPVAVIGGSAGSLNPLSDIVSLLGSDNDFAYIVIQHLDPKSPSLLKQILAKKTNLKIVNIEEGCKLEPNTIFILPPNKTATIKKDKFHTKNRSPNNIITHSIDTFLNSLALKQDRNCLAIILSGLGDDGSIGCEAISNAGGIVISQDEATSEFFSMPENVISTGCVDFILSPAEIANKLFELKKDSLAFNKNSQQDKLKKIFSIIKRKSGLSFNHYKTTTISRRIQRRMGLHNLEAIEDYVNFLMKNPNEIEELYNDLLINVTSFFRDPKVFDSLKKNVLSKILKKKSTRIWIVGCSTGEEAYSIAIACLEIIPDITFSSDIKIFATDVSEKSIAKARQGLFPSVISESLSKERLDKFFTKEKNGHYRIAKKVRELCTFAVQDINQDPPFSKIDFISCRNVLIYFDSTLQSKVFKTFVFSLNPGGFLLLGKSEHIRRYSEHFSVVDQQFKIYYKRLSNNFRHTEPTWSLEKTEERQINILDKNKALNQNSLILKKADDIIQNQASPVAVIIDQDLNILQVRGNAEHLLVPPTGAPSYNLLKMAREELRSPLRSIISKAEKNYENQIRESVRLKKDNSLPDIDIRVFPFKLKENDPTYFIVNFVENKVTDNNDKINEVKNSSDNELFAKQKKEIARLEQELTDTKDYLQLTIEEYETTNEELNSSNEEIISSNEELQSANEELQTAKEEVQSSNEELNTLNEELSNRNIQLLQSNNDLNNLINSSRIPLLFVSTNRQIRKFTKEASHLLMLDETYIGKSVNDIKTSFQIKSFEKNIIDVIDRIITVKQDIQIDKDKWLSMQICPYKTQDNMIDGAIVTFIDVSEIKNEEFRLNKFIKSIPHSMLVTNDEMQIVIINKSLNKLLGHEEYEILNKPLEMFIPKLSDLRDRNEKSSSDSIFYALAKSGESIPIHAKINDVNLSNAHYFIYSFTDIRENILNEERSRVIIESVPYPTIVMDYKGKILQTNSELQKLFGYTDNSLVGESYKKLIPDRYKEAHDIAIKDFVNAPHFIEKGTQNNEILGIHTSGREFPIDIAINTIKTKNDLLLVCSVRDISNEVELKAQKEKAHIQNLQKSSFLANMSHEIRTPLTAITGFAELLKVHPNLEESKKASYLDMIQKSGKHLSQIIDDILDLSKIDTGNLVIEKRLFNLAEEMDSVFDQFSVLATNSNLELKVTYEENFPKNIISDSTRIRQVLYNILGNSFKFTESGHIKVNISYTNKDSKFHICVEDTGCGIDEKNIHKVFMPFSQEDESTTRKHGGTGLGLSLSKKLAHLMGGDLKILKTKINKGSTFEFTFSAVVPTLENKIDIYDQKININKEFDLTEKKLSNIRLLLVEDGVENQQLFHDILSYSGAKVDIAEDGDVAKKLAMKDDYDLIIMDIQIPKFDGLEVTKFLRNKSFKNPIIALSSHAMKEEEERALQAGCNAYYSKPITANNLIDRVYEWIYLNK